MTEKKHCWAIIGVRIFRGYYSSGYIDGVRVADTKATQAAARKEADRLMDSPSSQYTYFVRKIKMP